VRRRQVPRRSGTTPSACPSLRRGAGASGAGVDAAVVRQAPRESRAGRGRPHRAPFDAEGRPQRPLSVREREEIQEVLRRGGSGVNAPRPPGRSSRRSRRQGGDAARGQGPPDPQRRLEKRFNPGAGVAARNRNQVRGMESSRCRALCAALALAAAAPRERERRSSRRGGRDPEDPPAPAGRERQPGPGVVVSGSRRGARGGFRFPARAATGRGGRARGACASSHPARRGRRRSFSQSVAGRARIWPLSGEARSSTGFWTLSCGSSTSTPAGSCEASAGSEPLARAFDLAAAAIRHLSAEAVIGRRGACLPEGGHEVVEGPCGLSCGAARGNARGAHREAALGAHVRRGLSRRDAAPRGRAFPAGLA